VSEQVPPREEARLLADAMYDRRMNAETMHRLDQLITGDQGCLQAYVERIDLHGEILKRSQERRQANLAANAVARMVQARDWRETRRARSFVVSTAACILCVVGLIGWLVWPKNAFSPQVGTVATLTANVPMDSVLELGQVLHKGKVLSIREGIATLQLPHVLVDLIGPAKVRLLNSRQIELQSGSLHAVVQGGGEGFTVSTQDSRIVDLGTEFLVTRSSEKGTQVSVRRGRTQATLLDWHGTPAKVLELTDNRAATFHQQSEQAHEIDFQPETFRSVDETRGGLRSIDGSLRTPAQPPLMLNSNQLTTPNHMLVIPERQHVVLKQDLVITGLEGPSTIPAGSTVSSYLIHYDPTDRVSFAPRGGVTFFGRIVAVLVSSTALGATDAQFGQELASYETADFRALELDEDQVRISSDRKTISFFFGVKLPGSLDEARILVVE